MALTTPNLYLSATRNAERLDGVWYFTVFRNNVHSQVLNCCGAFLLTIAFIPPISGYLCQ